MGVRVEGRGRLRVTERALDGHDVTPGRDQSRGVEVPQVVELDTYEWAEQNAARIEAVANVLGQQISPWEILREQLEAILRD